MDRNISSNHVDPEGKPPPAPIWINLGDKGCLGRTLGVVGCTVSGAIAGAFGSIFPYLIALYAIAGLLGLPEPSITQLILQGGWFLGLFGLLPGAVVGFVTALTSKPSAKIALYIVAIVISCACELLYGYPTSIPAGCFYLFGPFAVPFVSMIFSTAIKIRLGLMPPREAAEAEQSLISLFSSNES